MTAKQTLPIFVVKSCKRRQINGGLRAPSTYRLFHEPIQILPPIEEEIGDDNGKNDDEHPKIRKFRRLRRISLTLSLTSFLCLCPSMLPCAAIKFFMEGKKKSKHLVNWNMAKRKYITSIILSLSIIAFVTAVILLTYFCIPNKCSSHHHEHADFHRIYNTSKPS